MAGTARNVRLSGNVRHRSSTFTDAYDTPRLASGTQDIVNAGINRMDQTDHWSIGVVAENLFNNRNPQGGNYSPTSGPTQLVVTRDSKPSPAVLPASSAARSATSSNSGVRK